MKVFSCYFFFFFFSSRRRHTRWTGDWSSDVCSSDLTPGGNWSLEIVGMYADYGNPKGQIAVNFAALTRRFPEIPLTRMGLRDAPPKIPALISALQEKFGLNDRNVADQATMKAESTRIFNRTFSVTAALN